MSEVFICPTGSVSQRGLRDLRKAGVVVVETDDPARCSFIRASEVISGDDMLWAVLSALNVDGGYSSPGNVQRQALAGRLLQIVQARRAAIKGAE